jgi:putative oxidoreductase
MNGIRGFVGWCLLLIVAMTFAWAGTLKALDPRTFALEVDALGILPWPVVIVVTMYLPWLEIVTAVALLIPRWRNAAALLLVGLLAVFALVLISSWWRGFNFTCGCFGSGESRGFAWPLIRDLGLSSALVMGILFRRSTITKPGTQ